MENKKRTHIIILTLIMVTIIIISLAITYFYTTTLIPPLISPSAEMEITRGDGVYELRIVNITYASYMNKWLRLDRITFLLSPRPLPGYGEPYFPLSPNGGTTEEYYRALIDDKDNPYNMASGKLIDIVNDPNEEIVYFDNDNDLKVSINDEISINYSLIPENLTNEEFLFDLIYFGDLEGALSEDTYAFIGWVIIKNAD